MHHIFKWLALSLLVTLQACAVGGPPREDHAFSFNTYRDSPDFVIWDYRYSHQSVVIRDAGSAVHDPGWAGAGQSGIRGNLRIGDTLYVKWKNKETGELFEETASLVGRLPRDMRDKTIRFIVSATGLHVYVSGSNLKPLKTNECPRLRAEGRTNPTPDNRALAHFCADSLIKIHPEQKILIPEQKQ